MAYESVIRAHARGTSNRVAMGSSARASVSSVVRRGGCDRRPKSSGAITSSSLGNDASRRCSRRCVRAASQRDDEKDETRDDPYGVSSPSLSSLNSRFDRMQSAAERALSNSRASTSNSSSSFEEFVNTTTETTTETTRFEMDASIREAQRLLDRSSRAERPVEKARVEEPLVTASASATKSTSATTWMSRLRSPKGVLAVVVFLILAGSVKQGSSASVVFMRILTVASVRFLFRRAYSWAKSTLGGLRRRPRPKFRVKAPVMPQLPKVTLSPRVRDAVAKAKAKFIADKKGMLLIPVVAAFVGWFTNWLAVKMIFYPINFWGLPFMQYVEGSLYGFDILQPLGLIGWQGIVPAKAAQMSYTMVSMVTEKLVDVEQVFKLLVPTEIAALLIKEVPAMASAISSELIPGWAQNLAESAVPSLPSATLNEVSGVISSYLAGFVQLLQARVDAVIDLKELVVTAMCTDRVVLVDLFRQCGARELDFLVNSGLFFGFLLGVIQMAVWAFYSNPWSITIGGTIVGLATNWLALKCIFEPVEPWFIGPFKIQGLFLQRQHEVSGTFSDYLTSKVLKSERIWDNMLHGAKGPEFNAMLEEYTKTFVLKECAERGMSTDGMDVQLVEDVCRRVAERLPEHIHVLHDYTDETLGLQELMREKMKLMTPQEFERVLHPIFEQDELTLIISGGVLGALAGYLQQVYTVKQEGESDEADSSKV